MIARLRARGRSTELAEELLVTLETGLDIMRQHQRITLDEVRAQQSTGRAGLP